MSYIEITNQESLSYFRETAGHTDCSQKYSSLRNNPENETRIVRFWLNTIDCNSSVCEGDLAILPTCRECSIYTSEPLTKILV